MVENISMESVVMNIVLVSMLGMQLHFFEGLKTLYGECLYGNQTKSKI